MWREKRIEENRPYVGGYKHESGGSSSFHLQWNPISSIRYQTLPKYSDNRLTWKQCYHQRISTVDGSLFSGSYINLRNGGTTTFSCRYPVYRTPDLPSGNPRPVDLTDLFDAFYDSLDLNCRKSALAYSGIVQMVPLLGTTLRINSVLRRLASRLTRDLRRKPFSTVIRSAISLDFINRFAIKPTLDDMHTVQTAMDYTINTINEAWARSGSVVPYKVEIDNSSLTSDSSFNQRNVYSTGVRATGRLKKSLVSRSELHALATVYYKPEEIRPIQLWATRCGLTKPLGSIWDLIPFSFVTDYFFRTGEFIDGLENLVNDQDALKGKLANLQSLWVTEKVGRRTEWICESASLSGWYVQNLKITKGTARLEDIVFQRRPCSLNDYSQAGFWDQKWAGFAPSLSMTRKRTLVQLFLQKKLR